MRTRRRLTWIIFAVCILAVLEGLGWVTWRALRLERREREAQAQTQFQQSIRLALWRMESQVTPLIAAEAARPYFHYIPFYPAERAYTKMFQQVKANEVLVPSPLLESSGRVIRLHYQLDSDGTITSPQAPTGNMRDLAEAQYLDSEFIVLAGQLLNEVETMIHPSRPVTKLDAQSGIPTPSVPLPPLPPPAQIASQSPGQVEVFQQWQLDDNEYKARERAVQSAQTLNLADNRRKSQTAERSTPAQEPKPRAVPGGPDTSTGKGVDPGPGGDSSIPAPAAHAAKEAAPEGRTPDATTQFGTSGSADKDPKSSPLSPGKPAPSGIPVPNESAEGGRGASSADRSRNEEVPQGESAIKGFQAAARPEGASVEQGSFVPRWLSNPASGEEELLLERTVTVDGKEVKQGLWMDWPELRAQLIQSVGELLPAATLTPSTDTGNDAAGLRLAALPVRLLPGATPEPRFAVMTATNVTLGVTWAAVIGAIAAIGLVLRKAMELSERRGRFVSAVTHELRTPLTTFCLYTEMLADGMVADDASRREYLGTLKSESGRLARIVQNVLDYAGIGGVPRRPQIAAASMGAHELVAKVEPAIRACTERGGMTLVSSMEGIESFKARVDPQTLERILLNLVENSCKYASEASDKRVHFAARTVRMGGRPWLELTIRDHGPGVPKSERNKIFQAFHRAERDAKSTKSGLGLGLALARELARELGGRLTLNPSTGDGAEFVIRLPDET